MSYCLIVIDMIKLTVMLITDSVEYPKQICYSMYRFFKLDIVLK